MLFLQLPPVHSPSTARPPASLLPCYFCSSRPSTARPPPVHRIRTFALAPPSLASSHAISAAPARPQPVQQPLPSLPVFCLKTLPPTTTLTEIFHPSANSFPTQSTPSQVEEGLDLHLPHQQHIWRLASINTVCAWRLPGKTALHQRTFLRLKRSEGKKIKLLTLTCAFAIKFLTRSFHRWRTSFQAAFQSTSGGGPTIDLHNFRNWTSKVASWEL